MYIVVLGVVSVVLPSSESSLMVSRVRRNIRENIPAELFPVVSNDLGTRYAPMTNLMFNMYVRTFTGCMRIICRRRHIPYYATQ